MPGDLLLGRGDERNVTSGQGIVRELLRFVRLSHDGDPAYTLTWPDQPPVTQRSGRYGFTASATA
ncbi:MULTISPECIES: hypothetical protein [Streptomyces]|uniref:hypothetical protein n=1 Tax=Streptomyces TaxID=1883 RepID=UPI003444F6CF